MVSHGESAVDDDAEVAGSVRHRDASWYVTGTSRMSILSNSWLDPNHITCLRRIEPQSAVTQPVVDISQAGR